MKTPRRYGGGSIAAGSPAPATEEQWREFRLKFPGETIPRLLQRAIENRASHLVATILTNEKFDINAPCEPDLYPSLSPLMLALHADDPEIIKLLFNEKSLDIAQSLPGYGSLSWAAGCSLEVLQLFLDHPDTDINQQDRNGHALLHEVVYDLNGTDKLEFLLRQANCQIDIEQTDGSTPLYRAALAGNIDAVDLLLNYPVDVNNRNNDNAWSVLHVAAANNFFEIVEKLVAQQTVSVNAKDDMQNTPLHIGSEHGFQRVVASLITHPDIDINSKDEKGWTPLHAAAFAGHKDVVELLLSHPAIRINSVDQDRQTALHWAVQNKQAAVSKLLASHDSANLYITDRIAGQTPFDMAKALAYTEIADFLQAKMKSHPQLDELSADDDYQPRESFSDLDEPTFPLVPEILKKQE